MAQHRTSLLGTLTLAAAVGSSALGAGSLDEIVAPGTRAKVLGTGYGFCEGPAADAEGNVYFSDGKENSIHLYRPGQEVQRFVEHSTDANGMMFNAQGELVVCEGAAYRVVAFDVETKNRRVLVGAGPRRFNEPNDLSIDRQGGFYFTDPNYRHRGQEKLKKEDVYYVSADGRVTKVSDVCLKPNGILLTPDGKTLYLADCSAKRIYKYDVVGPGKLSGQTRWIELEGHPDGMTLDAEGNLYIACGGKGIQVYSPEGEKLGAIDAGYGVPGSSNCVFGGPDFSQLFITSGSRFLMIPTKARGVKPLPARE